MMNIPYSLIGVLFFCVFSITAWPQSQSSQRLLEDCEIAQKFYLPSSQKVLCNDTYLFFGPNLPNESFPQADPDQPLRVAAFNLYHLGNDQGWLKDLTLVAQIMNQWDIVGTTEMMPLPAKDGHDFNVRLSQALHENTIDPELKGMAYRSFKVSGYISLLLELQALDPSWSLIMSSHPQGEGTHAEAAGYYYRANQVQLLPTPLCAKAINDPQLELWGCDAPLPKDQMRLVSRRSFFASFAYGDFNFTGAVLHARFRPANDADIEQQRQTLCQAFGDDCFMTKDEVGRYYEVWATVNLFKEIENSGQDNIIFMGDFNLSYVNDRDYERWQYALHPVALEANAPDDSGYQVFQTRLSSLSFNNNILRSNYDHFIFNSSKTPQCNTGTISTWDFTGFDEEATDFNSPIFQSIQRELLPEAIERRRVRLTEEALNSLRLYRGSFLTKEKKIVTALINKRVDRLYSTPFWALGNLISDHLPIYMECRP